MADVEYGVDAKKDICADVVIVPVVLIFLIGIFLATLTAWL